MRCSARARITSQLAVIVKAESTGFSDHIDAVRLLFSAVKRGQEGQGMLDHRQEPGAICAANCHGTASGAIAFDRTDAADLARGSAYRLAPLSCDLAPANDAMPDANMASLRKAGVGAVSPNTCPAPRGIGPENIRNACQRSIAIHRSSSTLFGAWLSVVQLCERMTGWRSHTIVSNGRDDPGCTMDGAKRQR